MSAPLPFARDRCYARRETYFYSLRNPFEMSCPVQTETDFVWENGSQVLAERGLSTTAQLSPGSFPKLLLTSMSGLQCSQ
ncbi:hypothetical protein FKM82_003408 [Ascaphus truei]